MRRVVSKCFEWEIDWAKLASWGVSWPSKWGSLSILLLWRVLLTSLEVVYSLTYLQGVFSIVLLSHSMEIHVFVLPFFFFVKGEKDFNLKYKFDWCNECAIQGGLALWVTQILNFCQTLKMGDWNCRSTDYRFISCFDALSFEIYWIVSFLVNHIIYVQVNVVFMHKMINWLNSTLNKSILSITWFDEGLRVW